MTSEKESPFISVHINKTGGTSLRKFYVDVFGKDRVYFYYPNEGGLHKASDERAELLISRPILYWARDILIQSELGRQLYQLLHNIRQAKRVKSIHILQQSDLPEDFAVVHGHFQPDYLGQTIPKGRMVTVLREPIARAESNYRYWKRLAAIGHQIPETWFDPTMSFEDYAEYPDMVNFQSKALVGFSLSSFTQVGVTERLDCFCRFFDPKGRVPLLRLNVTRAVGRVDISDSFRAKFQNMNYLDYALYREAQARAI